jgi:hypothetical protein
VLTSCKVDNKVTFNVEERQIKKGVCLDYIYIRGLDDDTIFYAKSLFDDEVSLEINKMNYKIKEVLRDTVYSQIIISGKVMIEGSPFYIKEYMDNDEYRRDRTMEFLVYK